MREKKLKNQDVSHGRLIQLLLFDIGNSAATAAINFAIIHNKTNITENSLVKIFLQLFQDFLRLGIFHRPDHLYIFLYIVLKIFHRIIHLFRIQACDQLQMLCIEIPRNSAQVKVCRHDNDKADCQIQSQQDFSFCFIFSSIFMRQHSP